MRYFLLIAATLAFLAPPAGAHGPTPQKAEDNIAIAADPKVVWALIADFGAIASWHPMVAQSVSEAGNKPGAERKVALKSGGVLVDGLDEYDAGAMSYSYRLAEPNAEALPVSFYSATLTVKPREGGGSTVAWIGRFYRGDTGNFPPDALNDEAAIKAMSGFFRTGLEGLKAKAEKNG
ncbi:SRPBCC family protein [Methylocapsa aurea]|uniref:SRPBCC family protein n=1 Tax=Methylocapsa aurea TaxID=663610 RepID=UPI0005605EFA|nr:SRPBCC family protein [Methylocapsa aurea]